MKPVVKFTHVSKSFPKFSWNLKVTKPRSIFRNVSFSVSPGEIFGVLGPNGAGKTTLLKLASSITFPDSGTIITRGRVAPLIEIGAGFHPELTGRENIFLYGQLLGLSLRQLSKLESAIISFAEIPDYIDQPVKYYSSGMHVRLGFSVAVHSQPNILLVDEALAVGDAHFAQKSLKKIEQLTSTGTAIIFVTHNLYLVGALCRQVMYLDHGVGQVFNNPASAIKAYQKQLGSHPTPIEKKYDFLPADLNSSDCTITNLVIKSTSKRKISRLKNNQTITITAKYKITNHNPDRCALSLSLVRADGMIYFTESSHNLKLNQRGTIAITLTLQNINPAFYAFTLRIINNHGNQMYARATSPLHEVYSNLNMKDRVMGVVIQPITNWKASS